MDKVAQNITWDLLKDETANEIAVATTGVAYTDYFALDKDGSFGCELRLSSGGTYDVKVELEQGNTIPTDRDADADWGVGDEIVTSIADGNTKILKVEPVVSKYARIKFTGVGSNAATTKVIVCKLTFTPRN